MRWYLRPEDRLPQPPLEETDDRLPVLLGTAVWVVLAVVAWLRHDDLAADGNGWWLWTAVAGAALGVVGYGYMQRRKSRERAAAEAGPHDGDA